MFRFHPFAFREPGTAPSPVPAKTAGLSHPILSLALSATTLPLLGGIVLAHWLGKVAIELGQGSEELLRGDRLPLLKDLHTGEGDRPDA